MQNKTYVEKLKPEDFYEAIDLMDLVFSKSSGSLDFLSMLPGIYHPTQECADNHWIVKSDGRIVSSIGNFPFDVQIGGRKILLRGIGGVCTNKRENGKGYMRAVMEDILEFNRNNGVMLSYLGGERKRYGRYGYEKAGTSNKFFITTKNTSECSEKSKQISLELQPMSNDDANVISAAKCLHDSESIHFVRKETSFHTILTHWHNTPYVAHDMDNNVIGYLTFNPSSKTITEIYADNTDIFEAMIKTWVDEHGNTYVMLPPWKQSYIARMLRICEHIDVSNCGNWLIYDWETVIGALLEVKSTYAILSDGNVNIGIEGYGTLTINVKENKTECSLTGHTPDIVLDAFTATRLMCGHISPMYITALPPALSPLFMTWFPLPLYCPSPDAV